MSDVKKFKEWLLSVIKSRDINSANLFEDLFRLDIDNSVKADLTELINQVELQDINLLGKTPEILAEYFILDESDQLDRSQYLKLRKKIIRIINGSNFFDQLFDSYDEFKTLLKQALEDPELANNTDHLLKSKGKSFGIKFWRFICVVVVVAILPSTILQLFKLTYLIQKSDNDYSLGFATGQLSVNLVIIGLAIWFFVKLKKH
ncbi:MAG: hypothetical protein V1846_05145 [Candidatus Komeilibacteria bacterium]